jgi:hypothetical protein
VPSVLRWTAAETKPGNVEATCSTMSIGGIGGRDLAGCLNVPSNVRREVGTNGTTA